MGDDGRGWRRFTKLKVDRKNIRRRAKRVEGATVRHAHKFIVKRWDNIRGVRRHIIMWMSGVALLIAAVGLQMVWFQRSYVTSAPVSGGVYAEAVQGPLSTLNPLYATTSAELSASRLLFSSLYAQDTTGHLKGDLAARMTVDASGKVYTVGLRPDARWHDEYRVTAKDIVFTVNLMKNPGTRAVMNSSWKDIEATAVNDYEVQFTLPAAYASFPQALTFAVLPEHILGKVSPQAIRENAFSNNPVGSGPFELRLLQNFGGLADRKVVSLGAHGQYHQGAPRLERFQLHVYGSSDDIQTALRTSAVSAATDVTSDVARAVDQTRYDVETHPIHNGVYAIFNTTRPSLKSDQVRKALQVGTNTTELRSKLYGEPKPLYLPFVEGQLTGDAVPAAPVFNIAEANRLLDADGWARGNDGIRAKEGQQLKLHVALRKNIEYEKTLEVLIKQWRALGIAVEAQVVDPNTAGQSFAQMVLQQRNYDVLIDELMIGGDADVFAYWHSKGLLNFANYSNTVSDDALLSARSRTETQLRNIKYVAFAQQWLEDAPAIGLYQSNMIYIHSKTASATDNSSVVVAPADRYANILRWTADRGAVYKTP